MTNWEKKYGELEELIINNERDKTLQYIIDKNLNIKIKMMMNIIIIISLNI